MSKTKGKNLALLKIGAKLCPLCITSYAGYTYLHRMSALVDGGGKAGRIYFWRWQEQALCSSHILSPSKDHIGLFDLFYFHTTGPFFLVFSSSCSWLTSLSNLTYWLSNSILKKVIENGAADAANFSHSSNLTQEQGRNEKGPQHT